MKLTDKEKTIIRLKDKSCWDCDFISPYINCCMRDDKAPRKNGTEGCKYWKQGYDWRP